jgi:Uncharacterised protein conserved in bacteria (DUF2336)
MTTPPSFPGFDGLMTLSRREGVDIRPTLLRVLTDLYVQALAHSGEEERQFVELTCRLIDEVDDATRAVVRAQLARYPGTPTEVLKKLGLTPAAPDSPVSPTAESSSGLSATAPVMKPATEAELRIASNLSMQPKDAAELNSIFSRASGSQRALILHDLHDTQLRPSARIPAARARRAVETLEMAAFAADVENFTYELGETLILPWRVATEVVNDPGGEPLACAAKALEMPAPVFQRVLLFLKPEFGSSVHTVYRLSRLYDKLSERSALIMLAAWRGSSMAVTRAKFRPGLYDDEPNRARPASAERRPAAQQPGSGFLPRTGVQGSSR